MWWCEAIVAGFDYPTDPGRLQVFRILFGATLALRFALSIGQGGWHRFAPDSLSTQLACDRFGHTRGHLLACLYRPALILRIVAAAALTAGVVSRLSLLLVLAGAAMELAYMKSPNAIRYTLLCGTCLLLAGDLGHGVIPTHGSSTANTWAQCLLVLVTLDIYWNSAWQKIRSTQFRSGQYLAQWIHTYSQVKDRLIYPRQFAVPGIVYRHAGNLTRRNVGFWRLAAAATITAEIAIPLGLLIPPAMPYAIIAGIGMHATFSLLKPRQLLTFSGLTTATYVAFAA